MRFPPPVELTFKLWMLIPALGADSLAIVAHPGSVECHSGALERDRETTIALPKAVEAHSGVVEAYSGRRG